MDLNRLFETEFGEKNIIRGTTEGHDIMMKTMGDLDGTKCLTETSHPISESPPSLYLAESMLIWSMETNTIYRPYIVACFANIGRNR